MGGVLYIDEARVHKLSALSATLGEVDISSAKIGTLTVGTSNLGFDSVTDRRSYNAGTVTTTQGGWTVFASAVTDNPNPNPVFCEYSFSAAAHSNGGSFARARIRWRRDGVVLKEFLALASGTGGVPQDRSAGESGFFLDDSPVQGTNTYYIEVWNELGGGTVSASGFVKMVWWKR